MRNERKRIVDFVAQERRRARKPLAEVTLINAKGHLTAAGRRFFPSVSSPRCSRPTWRFK